MGLRETIGTIAGKEDDSESRILLNDYYELGKEIKGKVMYFSNSFVG